MQYSIRKLENSDLAAVIELAKQIYTIDVDDSKYPKFQVGLLLDDEENREKFFTLFMLPEHYKNFTQRQSYGIYEDDVLISAVGVRRYDHMPCWEIRRAHV